MAKTYTWEEIELFLEKELRNTKHILTYGTIGSHNIEHDIDTIITKKPKSPSSEFFREVHSLFNQTDKYLRKKHNARLIRTSKFSDEEEIGYIANIKENDLIFQVLTYTSFKQIKMHWFADLAPNQKLKKLLKNNYKCILGSTDDIFKLDFKEYKNEHLFIRLNDSDRINSHFPQDFLVNRMNVLFDFILRKQLGLQPIKARNKQEVVENFYKVCEILDRTIDTRK